MTYLQGAGLAAVMLLGSACQNNEKAGEITPVPQTAPEASTTSTTVIQATTTTAPVVSEPSTTTTTTAAPEPAYDWGPVICPDAGHPAHHEPCQGTRANAIHEHPSPQPRTVRPSSNWAIPDYIVACESGGSWDAENPSGAAGPYQLMPEHFGGESALNQSPEAQHAKATELWDGGNGASHWEQCL